MSGSDSGRPSADLLVERPGLRTTVQDGGRPGFAHLGVPRGGAADWWSARLANALVGNPASAAVLETTLTGPTVRFGADGCIAVTGAPAPVTLDGVPLRVGAATPVRAGQRLAVGTARRGLRSYLAVSGGIGGPVVLGSRSADSLAALGPAPLLAGQRLPLDGEAAQRPAAGCTRRAPDALVASVLPTEPAALRVIVEPTSQAAWFDDVARRAVLAATFRVTPQSDRVGVRLAGPAVARRGGEFPTQGMVRGAIQVPPDGQPIVLLADHAVTGGYPVFGVVIAADLPLLAQARPGTGVRFEAISQRRAAAAYAQRCAQLTGQLTGQLTDNGGG